MSPAARTPETLPGVLNVIETSVSYTFRGCHARVLGAHSLGTVREQQGLGAYINHLEEAGSELDVRCAALFTDSSVREPC